MLKSLAQRLQGGRRHRLLNQPAWPWRQRHRNGDISYVGQLDDDLVDLVKGLALDSQACVAPWSDSRRAAASCCASQAARQCRPVRRLSGNLRLHAQDCHLQTRLGRLGQPWRCHASLPCPLLNELGLPWFRALPAVHFATDAKATDTRTPVYSFRLAASLQLGRDWRPFWPALRPPTQIVVGADDELFNADRFSRCGGEQSAHWRDGRTPPYRQIAAGSRAC